MRLAFGQGAVWLLFEGGDGGEAFGGEAAVVAAVLDGVVVGDVVVLEEGFEAVVDGVAAFFTGDFHEADELLDFTFTEAGLDAGVDAEGLGGEDAAFDIGAAEEALADDGLEDVGELRGDLLLLVGGEEIHDALDGFWGVDGVEGRDDKVAGFGGGHGDLHGFAVAELANDDDVWVLAHALAEAFCEGFGVASDLALFDEGGVVLVGEFDGVLERDDGAGAELGDALDEGGEGGGFSGAGDAGDEDEAALEVTDVFHDGVVAEGGEVGDFGRDVAVDCFDVLAAEVDVATEAADVADLDGVVEFPFFIEGGALGFVHGAEDEIANLLGGEWEFFEWVKEAIDASGGWSIDGEVEVGSAEVDGKVKVFADFAWLVHNLEFGMGVQGRLR